ncbi:hypothetical protein ACIBUY_39860 [Streptomyces sp. NPDC050085]|uniref:hypothetical protein n=1 Tax=Streptomyces sp. NPDC050085 TaxID=3365600 RepID=UPI00378D9A5A
MRPISRVLRTGIVTTTAAVALATGAASGALAAGHPAGGQVRTVALAAEGYSATVSRLGPHAYRAEITDHGKKAATLLARGKRAATDVHGLRVELSPDGAVTSRPTASRHGHGHGHGHGQGHGHSPDAKASPSTGSAAEPTPSPGDTTAPDGQGFDDGDIVGIGVAPSVPFVPLVPSVPSASSAALPGA